MDKRIRRLGIFLMLLFCLLFLQLNNLQVFQASKLDNKPGNSLTASSVSIQPRGQIVSRSGTVLAESVPVKDQYHYLRQYPQGPLYADITGFSSLIYGNYGIEASYNKYLVAQPNPITSLSDIFSNNKKYVTNTVVLTVSTKLQQEAAKALGNLKGAVVAIDPSTGAVLAMYSSPTYNPNLLASHNATAVEQAWHTYQSNPSQPMLPRAYARDYPPGSTFKIVTTSAIFDHDPSLAAKVFPYQTQISLPDTTTTLSNYAHESCGGPLPTLLAVSCDTAYAQLGLSLGANNLHNEAQSFGFNQVPPLDVPGVAAAHFPKASSFAKNLPGLAYSAIGQENVAATALQMSLVAAAIANHGAIMAPHLMSQIRNSQDQVIKNYVPKLWKQATSAATASQVTQLMIGVVKNGTAQGIAIPGVQIAAKTGTAQTNLIASSNLSAGGSDNWMIAFAPAQNPKIAIAVVVPSQKGLSFNSTGAAYAGPVVKAMIQTALGLS